MPTSVETAPCQDRVSRRIASGGTWALTNAILIQGFSFLCSLLTARTLGQVALRELSVVKESAGTAGLLAGLGLGTTASKYIAQYRTSDPDRAGRALGTTLAIAIVSI